MQEKIAELMWARGERYEGSPDLHMNPMTVKVIADAIATLFERKVIWEKVFTAEVEERPGFAFDYVVLRKDDSVIRGLMPKGIEHGQRVRVVVEEIE